MYSGIVLNTKEILLDFFKEKSSVGLLRDVSLCTGHSPGRVMTKVVSEH